MDLMDIGWSFACLVDFGWVLDGSGMVFGWLRIDFDGFWRYVLMVFGWIFDGL